MIDFQEFIAGTGDLTSNWPSDHISTRVPKDRATKEFYAIDLDGVTLMKCAVGSDVKRLLRNLRAEYRGHKVEARFVSLTESDLRIETERSRKELWEDIKYK